MKLFVLVLNKTERLEDLLAEFMRMGISGATVLSSTGMARVLMGHSEDDLPLIGSLKTVLYPDRAKNNTIFVALRDDQLDCAVSAVERVVGDINQKDTGVIFTVPITFTKGLEGDCRTT
jgi:hypothetical protein